MSEDLSWVLEDMDEDDRLDIEDEEVIGYGFALRMTLRRNMAYYLEIMKGDTHE